MTTPNIILTGFMGTGKTTVGRRVAQALGLRFIDLDEVIARRAGKSVADIFIQDGEPAFRALEAAACRELAAPQGLVVATGGGAVVSPANRAALAAGGVVVCLTASVDTVLARLAQHTDRPLLAGDDRRARVSALLAQRAAAYAGIACQVTTDGLSVAAVVERVLAAAAGLPPNGHRLRIGGDAAHVAENASDAYDVLIAHGLLAQAGERCAAAGLAPGRCALVTNATVGALHGAALQAALARAGFEPVLIEVGDGEAFKTLETVAHIYGRLAAAKLARQEAVVALGGGVIGDMAGFAAATWLRGVPFVQIPTSLLAMVDASVGGKVGVDLAQGKNLVGAFKQPELVLMDPALLATLPAVELRCGMAEIIKAGIIADAALFEALETAPPAAELSAASLTPVIADAVRVKAEIVTRDPFELGDRAWLNLGHTFGHALELISGFRLRHGEAVGLGLIAAAALSTRLGLCGAELPERIRSLLARTGLPTTYTFDPQAALAAMGTDKKRRGRALRFVVIERIGRVRMIEDVAEAGVLAALDAIRPAGA